MKLPKILLGSAVVIIAILLISPWRNGLKNFVLNKTASIERSFTSAGKKTAGAFSVFHQIGSVKRQNNELASQIISLEVDRSKISELEFENKMLKKELGYAEENKSSTLVPARIIGRDPTNFLDYVMLDKGKKDGVNVDMAVISEGVLVGQVKDVYDSQCKVTLITSKDSLVMAMLQKSRSKGILRGGISGLTLEDITRDSNFEQGDYVVTSGLDGKLKEGTLIGKASGIQSSSSELFKNISVEPIADLSKLELVFIVK